MIQFIGLFNHIYVHNNASISIIGQCLQLGLYSYYYLQFRISGLKLGSDSNYSIRFSDTPLGEISQLVMTDIFSDKGLYNLTEDIPHIVSIPGVLLSAKCPHVHTSKLLISQLINKTIVAIPLSQQNDLIQFKNVDV